MSDQWVLCFLGLKTMVVVCPNCTRAKANQMELREDEMLEIADTACLGKKTTTKADGKTEVVTGDMVDRARLQIDTRKWLMSKLKPKKYGDRTTLQGDPDQSLELNISKMISSSDELLKKIRGEHKP